MPISCCGNCFPMLTTRFAAIRSKERKTVRGRESMRSDV
jgi:hypothetical protein